MQNHSAALNSAAMNSASVNTHMMADMQAKLSNLFNGFIAQQNANLSSTVEKIELGVLILIFSLRYNFFVLCYTA